MTTPGLCLRAGSFYYINQPWIDYRQRDDSIMAVAARAHRSFDRRMNDDLAGALGEFHVAARTALPGMSRATRRCISEFCLRTFADLGWRLVRTRQHEHSWRDILGELRRYRGAERAGRAGKLRQHRALPTAAGAAEAVAAGGRDVAAHRWPATGQPTAGSAPARRSATAAGPAEQTLQARPRPTSCGEMRPLVPKDEKMPSHQQEPQPEEQRQQHAPAAATALGHDGRRHGQQHHDEHRERRHEGLAAAPSGSSCAAGWTRACRRSHRRAPPSTGAGRSRPAASRRPG